jgi:hypothetical protein
MTIRKSPPIDVVRQLLSYDPMTGRMFWRSRTDFPHFNGREAFNAPHINGYKQGSILGNVLLSHRVAWAHFHGYWPTEIDHINGNRTDNRIENLREVDRSTNNMNHCLDRRNKSGISGVDFRKDQWKWRARITVNRKTTNLGLFDTREDAIRARQLAEQQTGFHQNHNRPNIKIPRA